MIMNAKSFAGKPQQLMGSVGKLPIFRPRQLKRTFHNLLLTAVCGFTTILVLRGGAGLGNTGPDPIEEYSSSDSSELSIPLIKSGNAHITQQSFYARRDNPSATALNFASKHGRSVDQSEGNSGLSSRQDRPLRGLASSQMGNDRPASGSDASDPQRTRLLAEDQNLLHVSSQAHRVASTSHHLSSAEMEIPNPTSDHDPTGNPNLTLNLHGDPESDPDTRRPFEASLKETSFHHSSSEGMEQHHDAQPSILLVTGSQPVACENPTGDFHLTKALKNKMDYCRLHNIDIFYSLAEFDPQMTSFWAKLPLVYTLMQAHPEKEWFWWMDSDAMITDMAFKLPMERYKDYNLVVHGWDHDIYREKPDWVGLNAGIYLIRNCEWSMRLMEAWAPMGPKGKVRVEAGRVLTKALAGRPEFEADDQSALIYLLNTQKEKWASKVYLENSYFLHGYWMLFVEKYEEMMEKYHPGLGDERWPFITHFVGCKPCKHYTNTQPPFQDKCLKHMERAFNFADNQVLQAYGFRHQALDSHKITRQEANPAHI